MSPPFSEKLRLTLTGKQLLQDELLQMFTPQEIEHHLSLKLLKTKPSIIKKAFSPICLRCHNDQPHLFAKHYCARCRTDCTYCRNCINMGKASTCNPIIQWVGPPIHTPPPPDDPILHWEGTLSKPQQQASQQLKQAIKTQSSTLVHAVCGAGKTEILFEAIAFALSLGQRICIATPRRDVVQELFPRLQRAFSSTLIEALYGGSDQRNDESQLVIATTHQLFRYRHAFDVLIIDEVDAFPFTADVTLQKAAENARKSNSTLIYLTATPTKPLLDKVKTKELQKITITARYHGYPLPEPVTSWAGNWKKSIQKNRLPHSFKNWIEKRLQSTKPMLIFLPDIEAMHTLETLLKSYTSNIASVHAKDPDRTEKVEQMRSRGLHILLTTTILERGVTFSNIDVAVLGADEKVFTESALVQIAGRAGRDTCYPAGNVTFFHYGHTNAIINAQQHIGNMNKEARRDGLLKGECR